MKIVRVRWALYRIPFKAPYVTSRAAVSHREGLVVEMTTETGQRGLGEAAPDPSLAIPADRLAAKLEGFAELLLDADIEEVSVSVAPEEGVFDPVEAAIACAIDVAIVSALASSNGTNAASSLRPSSTGVVLVNALVGGGDIATAQDQAAVARRAGFSAVKLKVGALPSLDAERERVAAVRAAVGSEVRMRLDPNGAWTESQAVAALRAFATSDIEYVEQPVPPGDLDMMARVRAAVDVPIAADEDVSGLAIAERIIAADAAEILILKPQRLGGLRPCVEIAKTAEATGLHTVITTSVEAGVGTAACLHLAAAAGGPYAHGLATLDLLEDDLILEPGLAIENGRMRVPDAPGLGVTLDEEALKRYSDGWREVSL